ncbi:hypothetical protein J6590_091386 [Homalodisca vitripennis]|nr:hypothetical protein J6590_091386 [Homalodisca vitripennis]
MATIGGTNKREVDITLISVRLRSVPSRSNPSPQPPHSLGFSCTLCLVCPYRRLSCTVDSNVSWNGAGVSTSKGLEAGTTSGSISTERRLMDAYRPKLVSG